MGECRCTRVGKYPNMLEKLWGTILGVILACLLAKEASSRAVINPAAVTRRAATLSSTGIVIIGVFSGVVLSVISRPAIILPTASRLIGLTIDGLLSSMGENGEKRGKPIGTK